MTDTALRHATTVAIRGRALMIEGPSGTGKSSVALELIAIGARLVADDATLLWRGVNGVGLWAGAPGSLPAAIEARGLGLVPLRPFGPAPLFAVLALAEPTCARLPEEDSCSFFGQDVALFRRPAEGLLVAGLFQRVAAMPSRLQ